MTDHTILLIQKNNNPNSRTYSEHRVVSEALEHIIALFEQRLKTLHPHSEHINYHIDELNMFIDNHHELVALTLDNSVKAYVPRDRAWLKVKINEHLTKQARAGKN
ncbi:enhancer of rudimentary [Ramicandelaber brevisporus]|nr:enhancer of rudimentary [Ramicandelaber brevisporus]